MVPRSSLSLCFVHAANTKPGAVFTWARVAHGALGASGVGALHLGAGRLGGTASTAQFVVGATVGHGALLTTVGCEGGTVERISQPASHKQSRRMGAQ